MVYTHSSYYNDIFNDIFNLMIQKVQNKFNNYLIPNDLNLFLNVSLFPSPLMILGNDTKLDESNICLQYAFFFTQNIDFTINEVPSFSQFYQMLSDFFKEIEKDLKSNPKRRSTT